MDRLLSLVRREPEDREGIKAVLEAAHERALLDAESYQMIRALAVSGRHRGRHHGAALRAWTCWTSPSPSRTWSPRSSRPPTALSRLRRRPRQHHRHPAGQGPAALHAGTRHRGALAGPPGGLHSRIQAPERAAARIPRQPQPSGHRHRRTRRHLRPGHHGRRAGADRRRHRGRIRRDRGRLHLPRGREPAARGHRDLALQRRSAASCPTTSTTASAAGWAAAWAASAPRRSRRNRRSAHRVARGDARRALWLRVRRPAGPHSAPIPPKHEPNPARPTPAARPA